MFITFSHLQQFIYVRSVSYPFKIVKNLDFLKIQNLNFSFRDEVQKMFDEKDKDLDGYLSFEEFTGQTTKIELAFRAMDKDGDGYVSKKEFRQVCKGLSDEQVEAAFKKFDQAGNGRLDYREFCKMMNQRKERKANKESAGSST